MKKLYHEQTPKEIEKILICENADKPRRVIVKQP